jgi:hypothetical protein
VPNLIAPAATDLLPAILLIGIGDLLLLPGTGARLVDSVSADGVSTTGVIEVIGAYGRGTIGTDGHVHAPAGMPDTVAIRAHALGRARIEIVSGGLGRPRAARQLDLIVQG